MREAVSGFYARHYETLSLLFIAEVAFVAFFLEEVTSPGITSPFIFLLSLFVCPLVVAWPARNARLLRGTATNALFVLFLFAYSVYLRGWPVNQYLIREFLTVFAFGMVSGMAAGGRVERWRNKRAGLNPPRPLPLLTAPVSSPTDDYFSSASVSSYRV
jgi:putative membrane protein (TIGR04086 family)